MISRLLINHVLNKTTPYLLRSPLVPRFTLKTTARFSSSHVQSLSAFEKIAKGSQDFKISQASEALSQLIEFSSGSNQKEAIKVLLNMTFSNKLPKELRNDEKLHRLLENDPKAYISYLLFEVRNEINALRRDHNKEEDSQRNIERIDQYLKKCKEKLTSFEGSEDYQNLFIKVQLSTAEYQSFVASASQQSLQKQLLQQIQKIYQDLKKQIPQAIQTQKLKLIAKHEEPFLNNQTFEDRRAQMQIMRQQPCLLIEMFSHTILNSTEVASKINFLTKKEFTPEQIAQHKQAVIQQIKKAIAFYQTFKTTTSSQVYHKLKMAVIQFGFDIKLAAIQSKLRENMNYNVTNDVEEYKKEFIEEMQKYYDTTVDDLSIIQISGGKQSYNSCLAVCHTLLHLAQLLALKLKSNDRTGYQTKMREEKEKILTYIFKEEDRTTISQKLEEQLAHILLKSD